MACETPRQGIRASIKTNENMGNIKILSGTFETKLELEHAAVVAGFPSPADDYKHDRLDFNRDYIRHPEASFYGDVDVRSVTWKVCTRSLPVSTMVCLPEREFLSAVHSSVLRLQVSVQFTSSSTCCTTIRLTSTSRVRPLLFQDSVTYLGVPA